MTPKNEDMDEDVMALAAALSTSRKTKPDTTLAELLTALNAGLSDLVEVGEKATASNADRNQQIANAFSKAIESLKFDVNVAPSTAQVVSNVNLPEMAPQINLPALAPHINVHPATPQIHVHESDRRIVGMDIKVARDPYGLMTGLKVMFIESGGITNV